MCEPIAIISSILFTSQTILYILRIVNASLLRAILNKPSPSKSFTILTVSLSGLLSIPTMFVFIAFKKHRLLEFIVVGILAIAVAVGVVYVISLIPEDIDIIRDWGKIYWALQDFLTFFAETFFIFGALLSLMTGMVYNGYMFNLVTTQNGITLAIIFGIIVVCLALIYLLSKPLFFFLFICFK